MSVNPDTIPRYAPPTPAELEEMCGEPEPRHTDPDERMELCIHSGACMRLWRIYIGPLSERPDGCAAETLDCCECLAYEEGW